jgi:hypothetical protein
MDYLLPGAIVGIIAYEAFKQVAGDPLDSEDDEKKESAQNVPRALYAKNAYIDFQQTFGSRNFGGPQIGPVRVYNDGLAEWDVHANGAGVPSRSFVRNLL